MTKLEALKKLEEPLVVRTDDKVVIKLGVLVGLMLGYFCGFVLAAGLSVFAGLGKAASLTMGGLIAVTIVAVCAFAMWRRHHGYALTCDTVGMRLFRYGELHWSVPWEHLKLEGYGFMNSRVRLVLPDGTRVEYVEPYFGSKSEARRVRAILAAFEIERSPRRVTWISLTVWSVVGGTIGFPLLSVGRRMVDLVINDPERTTPVGFVEVLPGIAVLMAGGLGASIVIVSLLFAQAKLMTASYRYKGSDHGPLWTDFVRDNLREVFPVELQEGVRYRYLDPRRLKSHVQVVAALWFVFGGFAIVPWLAPSDSPDAEILRVLKWALPILLLIPFALLNWERRRISVLENTYNVEHGRLVVERQGRREVFPLTPVRVARGLTEGRMPKFMTWWEEYENERGRIRIDRRFLWPVE